MSEGLNWTVGTSLCTCSQLLLQRLQQTGAVDRSEKDPHCCDVRQKVILWTEATLKSAGTIVIKLEVLFGVCPKSDNDIYLLNIS